MRLSAIDSPVIPFSTVYEDAIPSKFCEKLIRKFEEDEGDHRITTVGGGGLSRRFSEINISLHWQDEHDIMVTVIQPLWKAYMAVHHIDYLVQWPKQFGYEQFRMKKYEPNGQDEFGTHTDVGSYATARRFLAFLWYLNTVEVGGETTFGTDADHPSFTVPAVRGRVLMFPPLWTHVHRGCKPISGPKYIVSGYLHYV